MATVAGPISAASVPSSPASVTAQAATAHLARQSGIMPEYEYADHASQQYHASYTHSQASPYHASISPQPTISIDRGGSGSSYALNQEQYRQPQPSPSPTHSHSYSQSPNPAQSPYTPSPNAGASAYIGSSSSNSHLASTQYYALPSPVPAGHYSKSPAPPLHHQPSPTKYHQRYTPNGTHRMDGSMDWQQQAGPSMSRRPSGAVQQDHRASMQVARVEYEDGRVGTEDPFAERSYTEIKCLGDGSFGTVWLCDWLSPVRQDTYLSAMQCGAGARPEWAGKRLVALKRMKRVWENGWTQAKNLGELASLRLIPPHDNIIPLYDAFISPKSRELYFVFECMEGNLYQLTKSRRGRPLAAGLIASCFHQISAGLYHIHQYGYFHRDMKPENLLVTTTGLTDYLTAATLNSINSSRSTGSDNRIAPGVEMRYEKDVSVIVKLADFGLARATKSKPPYTEYVSTRWYRAPEVLLRSREYGPPVDMWALGTILAEMVNLKPLFPGVSEIDQVYRICGTLGDPSAEYGHDERGKTVGGGAWNTGIKLAKNVGFSFPKRTPVHFRGLFNENVPQSLVDCILDLLRYNPRYRLTSAQCIEHPYFHETLPHLRQTPPIPRVPFAQGQPQPRAMQPTQTLDAPPRQLPPSHTHQTLSNPPSRPAFADGDMRTLPPPMGTPDGIHSAHGKLFFPSHGGSDGRVYGASALVNQLRELDLPTEDLSSYGVRPLEGEKQWEERPAQVYDATYDSSSSLQQPPSLSGLHLTDQPRDRPTRPSKQDVARYVQDQQTYYDNATPTLGGVAMMPPIEPIEPDPQPMAPPLGVVGKKKKWGLSSVFGSSEKHLPPVDEHSGFSGSSALKRTPSGSPAARPAVDPSTILDPKKAKKEAERQAREAEKARRELAVQQQKERARAVMRKREQVIGQQMADKDSADFEYDPSATVDGRKVVSKADVGRLGNVSVPTNNLGPVASMVNLHHGASTSHLHAGASTGHMHPGASSHLGASTSSLNPMGASASRLSLATALQLPANQSVASVRSMHQNTMPPLGEGSQLSMAALAARDRKEMEKDPIYGARHKARRRDDDADHSRSSLDVNSLKSRSALTIGTIDSDPGPHRLNVDPMLEAQARRHASHGYKSSARSSSKSRLMSGSNLSQESQLANDFRVHANVASSSSTSLGRHGQSSMNLQDIPPVPTHYMQYQASGSTEVGWQQGRGSAPVSPYGHPKGTAVAMGQGIGRDYMQPGLPPISDWEGQGQINPMFRVPPAQGQSTTTLPPFSALASVADQQRPKQPHER